MSDESNVPSYSYSDLQEVFSTLSSLEEACLSHLEEIAKTKRQLIASQKLAQIKFKVYPYSKKDEERQKND